MTDLAGKSALVTASSRGLGRACAKALAAAGAEVWINGRDSASLEQAADAIRAEVPGAGVNAITADLGTPEGREILLGKAGDVDILVLNVGGPPVKDVLQFSGADWHESFEQIFVSCAELLTRALPQMQARGWGRVVAVTSIAVKAPLPNLTSSTVCRLGLQGLMTSLKAEAIAHGVTLNCILPGRILTDRQRDAVARDAARQSITFDARLAAAQAEIPAGRFGKPEELGALCAFLSSPIAAYITGQSILVDGALYPGTF